MLYATLHMVYRGHLGGICGKTSTVWCVPVCVRLDSSTVGEIGGVN
jgi:hypothetical protein